MNRVNTLYNSIVGCNDDKTEDTINENTLDDSNIPVVYNCLCDPTKHGVTGKVTGTIGRVPLDELLGTFKKITDYKKLAILFSHEEEMSKMQMEQAASLAEASGSEVVKIETHDTNGAFAFDGADAAFITAAANLNDEESIKNIVRQTKAQKIATASAMTSMYVSSSRA